ncbi:MAG: protein-L-isoaspartate O-methyltransferase [Gammaproteobacteria bacterium]|nr:protein-L-isoaspartate O-methyltransferase [Gammaproteobacteria bacterium]NNL99909.1 protein-L-isoaspartate O-methyltransferase [Gammaproteobacteria bacterium]
MDFERARENMVESQIRTWEVLDQTVLDALAAARRETFVPSGYENLAFADTNIPIGHGEVMMTPPVEARLLQALALNATDKVLEIGTGTGFLSSLLAALAGQVISVDIHDDFVRAASDRLAAAGISNVFTCAADGLRGHAEHAPYDAIAVTGSLREIDNTLLSQLAPGGRLFAVVGSPPVMQARLITRRGAQAFGEENLFETQLPPLVGVTPADTFEF